ncbi:hypothetical protein [Salegentibacter chungangensis]|uniref:DUF4440 domain-containing protein n=1 Tax=Salegentibacter chungangensis TaxID=1335724 RepID=A0ABW3NRG9_9FLAO
MFKKAIFCLILLGSGFACDNNKTEKTEKSLSEINKERDQEIKRSPKAIQDAVLESYRAFSFKEGSKPDYKDLRSKFTSAAQVAFKRGDSLMSLPVDEYLKSHQENVEQGNLRALEERQVFSKTEFFGNIAHHLSTYEARINSEDSIAERGIISYQLLKKDDKWLIHSMIWDSEKENLPIPEEYLKN